MPVLTLIDGSGFVFRAFHALPPLTTPQGVEVGAVVGFCTMILKLYQAHRPTHWAVAFDRGRCTYRQGLYADYKAHRPSPPPEIRIQFDIIKEFCHAMRIPVLEEQGVEADDLIASMSQHTLSQGEDWQVEIVSSDKDMGQLVGPRVRLYDPMKQRVLDESGVQAVWGVRPDQVPCVQALAGDASDGIPGIPGVGIKTAVAWVAEFGSLDTLLAQADRLKTQKKRELVKTYSEQARMCYQLAFLQRHLPVPVTAPQCFFHAPDAMALDAFVRRHHLVALRQRLVRAGWMEPAHEDPSANWSSSIPMRDGGPAVCDQKSQAFLESGQTPAAGGHENPGGQDQGFFAETGSGVHVSVLASGGGQNHGGPPGSSLGGQGASASGNMRINGPASLGDCGAADGQGQGFSQEMELGVHVSILAARGEEMQSAGEGAQPGALPSQWSVSWRADAVAGVLTMPTRVGFIPFDPTMMEAIMRAGWVALVPLDEDLAVQGGSHLGSQEKIQPQAMPTLSFSDEGGGASADTAAEGKNSNNLGKIDALAAQERGDVQPNGKGQLHEQGNGERAVLSSEGVSVQGGGQDFHARTAARCGKGAGAYWGGDVCTLIPGTMVDVLWSMGGIVKIVHDAKEWIHRMTLWGALDADVSMDLMQSFGGPAKDLRLVFAEAHGLPLGASDSTGCAKDSADMTGQEGQGGNTNDLGAHLPEPALSGAVAGGDTDDMTPARTLAASGTCTGDAFSKGALFPHADSGGGIHQRSGWGLLSDVPLIEDVMVMSYSLYGASQAHDLATILDRHAPQEVLHADQISAADDTRLRQSGNASWAGAGALREGQGGTRSGPGLPVWSQSQAQVAGQAVRLFAACHHLRAQMLATRTMAVYGAADRALVPVLAQMERLGIQVDDKILHALDQEWTQQMEVLQAQVMDQAGVSFLISSPKQLGEVLFDTLGMPGGKRGKSGTYQTGSDVLEGLAAQGFDLPKSVLQWRQLAKLRNTYTQGLLAERDASGRVHTCYALTTTSTGRLASAHPNLQNIPVRTGEGRRIRQAFVAPAPYGLLRLDYSQIELRLLAHMGNIAPLQEAFRAGRDVHADTAHHLFHCALEDVTPDQRRFAKGINFGILYGMTPYGLASHLGISPQEAKTLIQTYFARYPGIQDYMHACIRQAEDMGFVRTLLGRRCFIPGIHSPIHAVRQAAQRQAMNAPLQGTSADLIKMAMIQVDHWLRQARQMAQNPNDPMWPRHPVRMVLQIHDELILEVHPQDVSMVTQALVPLMEQAWGASLTVPLQVGAIFGHSWGDESSIAVLGA